MEQSIAVVGAGSWGTALAIVLADNGYQVDLWARRENLVQEMKERRTNQMYLPDVALPDSIFPSSDLKKVVKDKKHIIVVVPSAVFRETIHKMADTLSPNALIAHATKGFDAETLQRMTVVLSEELSFLPSNQLAVISGPSHAEEVSRRSPTTVVVASSRRETAESFQDLLMNSNFRVYTHPDVIGTELGGALKNIIALGVGISDGLGYGDNAKAAIMTRGLSEIGRLGVALGASNSTFAGLAGVGDLIVTCTSKHSRNWRAGYLLGQGHSVEDVLSKMNMVVEGIRTTQTASRLAHLHHVEMPITTAIFQMLFEGKSPKAAVEDLMGRMRTHEMEEVARTALYWES